MAGQRARAEERAAMAPHGGEIVWHDDYTAATNQAVQQGKMLFLYFYQPGNQAARCFEARSLVEHVLAPRDRKFVWARIPVSSSIQIEGKQTRLLACAAFREMQNRQGIAIVDYQNRDPSLYGQVVSAFPFKGRGYHQPAMLATILDLPAGTITQRTMVFAVRIHPEAPASTQGELSRILVTEAQSHSSHQASIGVQGHHSWDTRFHRINSRLPQSLTAQEVVAESWPDKDLVEACVDCVDSWRQSDGHWSAVRGRHRMFGYDIKRGINGIWYATGLFAR
jgi:hypothetical protein